MPKTVHNFDKRKQIQANPEILPKVLQILELILKSEKKKAVKDIYTITFEKCEKIRSKKLGREYEELITRCIANYRYKEAIKLLWMICLDKSISHTFIFKAAMIIFNNLEGGINDDTMINFMRAVKKFKHLNKREILLENILYCLKNDMQNIDQAFQNSSVALKKVSLRKNDEIDPILAAYTSLIYYIDWCKYNNSDMMQSHCEALNKKATFEYGELFEKPGQWDIFILKLIEMMELSGNHNDIENLLIKYVKTNPNDLNGYIYICVHYYYNNPDSENFVKYLVILADKCPSDPRVLWLLEIWNKQGQELKKCLKYIFMFLDYPSNGKNVMAWKLLLQYLSQVSVKGSKKELKAIQKLWNSRSSSWKWMYFNPRMSQLDVCDSLLIALKVAILSFFEADHKFIKEMKSKVPCVEELVNSLQEEMGNIT